MIYREEASLKLIKKKLKIIDMGLIREPLNVDFVVDPRPLMKEEKKAISDFIKADKLKRAKGFAKTIIKMSTRLKRKHASVR